MFSTKYTAKRLSLLLILLATFWLITAKASAQESFSSNKTTEDHPIVIYGDTRNGHQTHRKIIQCILKYRPVAVFNTGDLVFNGRSQHAWDVFNDIVADLVKVAPLYPVMGNHELGRLKVKQDLVLPNNGRWYSVDIQNIHCVVVDVTSKYTIGSAQYNWLLNDLSHQPTETKFTIVLMHYPIYTSSFHQTQLKKLRKNLVPLFEKCGVDAVFCAHNHSYERCFSNGIYYITTAGGGAPLYAQQRIEPRSQKYVHTNHFCTLTQAQDSLIVTAIDTNLLVIDRFSIPVK